MRDLQASFVRIREEPIAQTWGSRHEFVSRCNRGAGDRATAANEHTPSTTSARTTRMKVTGHLLAWNAQAPAVRARTAAINELKAIIVTADESIRSVLRGMRTAQQVASGARVP